MSRKTAIIIGAGPAGLTAAYELLTRSDILPIVVEKSEHIGGVSRTAVYKGNRIDIGGHRFFSKSDRVMDWWLQRLPLDPEAPAEATLTYHNRTRELKAAHGATNPENVMLLRNRKSRIYFAGQFFDYPIQLNVETLLKLGVWRSANIFLSYVYRKIRPVSPEDNLEAFYINRFGQRLYETFFKSYTEKVWGTPCREISAEWGAQRVKGLSIVGAILHYLKKTGADFRQKKTETSLVEKFLYPRRGPGQMWETVAEEIENRGGKIILSAETRVFRHENGVITAVEIERQNGEKETLSGDYFFTTLPVRQFFNQLTPQAPEKVAQVAEGLLYRDMMIVGLLVKTLRQNGKPKQLTDNWIYLQDPDVRAGRLQIFNNWSPDMAANPQTVWVGVEYFCNETDELWNLPDDELVRFAAQELQKIGMLDVADLLDGKPIRSEKSYPAYFGSYNRFSEIIDYLNGFENLFPIGRNGMHKYNNQDHSMLTAMTAVDVILSGNMDKSPIWAVNTEEEYLEEK